MTEEYIICNKKYQIEKVWDSYKDKLNDYNSYYNVYNKKDMQVERSFAHLKSAKKYCGMKKE